MAATLGAVMAGNGHIAHAGYYNQNGVPPFGGRHPSMKSMEMSSQIWFGIGNCWSTPVWDKGIMASQFEGEPVNEQVVANMYGAMRSELNQIYSKITELEMEVSEHSLVISAIQPLDPSRRCYRMIGGVLVERTIKEVMPAVQRNKEGLEEVIARLNEALEKKKKEITQFEAKYKIRIRKPEEMKEEDSSRKEGTAQGVLVGPASGGE